jgi:hypothetical protein
MPLINSTVVPANHTRWGIIKGLAARRGYNMTKAIPINLNFFESEQIDAIDSLIQVRRDLDEVSALITKAKSEFQQNNFQQTRNKYYLEIDHLLKKTINSLNKARDPNFVEPKCH